MGLVFRCITFAEVSGELRAGCYTLLSEMAKTDSECARYLRSLGADEVAGRQSMPELSQALSKVKQ